jgi:hypothetical protein
MPPRLLALSCQRRSEVRNICVHGVQEVAGVNECPHCRVEYLEGVLRQIGEASASFKPICDRALRRPSQASGSAE